MGGTELGAGISLIERDTELDLFRRLTERAGAGRGAVVEIAGAPGVGRGSLVAAARTMAEQAGVTVLYARGSHTESGLDFGVLSQFLAGLEPAGSAPDPAAAPAALCRPFLAAAREKPLMIALDDAHWLDECSWQWLLALARRAAEAPLLIVFSTGQRGHAREAIAADVREQVVQGDVEWHVLRPAELSPNGVGHLLAEAGGVRPQDGFVAYVTLWTCGLPMLLRSTLEALRRGELTATEADEPGFQACLRRDALDWADDVLGELSADQLALLRAVTVGGDDLDWELVVSLARLSDSDAARTGAELRGHRVIFGDPPRVVCPHTRERVLAHMSRRERDELFARAAELGHRAAIGTSGLARLLLSAPAVGQPWAVRALREEAAHAHGAGQSERAATLLARALREPLDERSRARVLIELASAELPHAPEQSDRRLVGIVEGPGTESVGAVRVEAADLLLARGDTEAFQHGVTVALTSASLPAGDRAALEGLYWLAVDAAYDPSAPVRPVLLPERPADPTRSAAVAWQLLLRGRDRARSRELARAALGAGARAPLSARIIASRVLFLSDDTEEADAGLDVVLVDAHRRGARSATALARLTRAHLGVGIGRLDEAADDLSRALAALPLRSWHPMAQPGVRAVQLMLHLEAGELSLAEKLAAAELPPGVESGLGWSRFSLAKGLFWLRTGEPGAAVEYAQEAGRRMLASGMVNPALVGWRSLAALAYGAGGNAAAARQLVLEETELAQRWGAPSVIGLAGLTAASVLDGPERLASLLTAVEALRDSPSRLGYANGLLMLASARRKEGQHDAAVRLAGEAAEVARAAGGYQLAARARALSRDRLRTPAAG